MNYGYIRVSSITQNIQRQLEEIRKYEIKEENIFIDKESGKDFNRNNYQILKTKIKKDDLIIIKSIDRLGRNYQAIIDEWRYITKTIQANILVIDMPILDTRQETNLIGIFISDIVLQILSFVSENERINIRLRQQEGIRIAKQNGVKFGRENYQINEKFKNIAQKYSNKKIQVQEALQILNISRSTFYKYLKKI